MDGFCPEKIHCELVAGIVVVDLVTFIRIEEKNEQYCVVPGKNRRLL